MPKNKMIQPSKDSIVSSIRVCLGVVVGLYFKVFGVEQTVKEFTRLLDLYKGIKDES